MSDDIVQLVGQMHVNIPVVELRSVTEEWVLIEENVAEVSEIMAQEVLEMQTSLVNESIVDEPHNDDSNDGNDSSPLPACRTK